MMNSAKSFLLLCGALLLSGCSVHDCTDMGCSAHVNVNLSTALSQEGSYVLEVSADTETFSCTVAIPLDHDEACESPISVEREEITTVEGDAVHGRSGNAIVGVTLEGEFETVSLSIARDGELLADEDIEPNYEGVEINGEGCGECPIAEHELAVEN